MPTVFDTNKEEQKTINRRFDVQSQIHPSAHAISSVEKLMHAPSSPMNFFTSYTMNPKGVNFVNQEPDETILIFLRRHFITNVAWILLTAVLYIIPLLFFTVISLFTSLVLPQGLTIILTGFYYLLVTSYAFGQFISWFYNVGVVTQKRIIDLDSINILAHNTATANFNEIVDVKFDQRGFLQSTFDYGNIHIQTEAIKANFEFDAAPKPTIVTDVISDLRVAQKGYHGDS